MTSGAVGEPSKWAVGEPSRWPEGQSTWAEGPGRSFQEQRGHRRQELRIVG